MTSAAGAEMTDAVRRWPASIPIPTKTAKSPPVIVAKPPTINAFNSERVMPDIKGLTTSGASV